MPHFSDYVNSESALYELNKNVKSRQTAHIHIYKNATKKPLKKWETLCKQNFISVSQKNGFGFRRENDTGFGFVVTHLHPRNTTTKFKNCAERLKEYQVLPRQTTKKG